MLNQLKRNGAHVRLFLHFSIHDSEGLIPRQRDWHECKPACATGSWCNATGVWETRCPGRNSSILMAHHCPTPLTLPSPIALSGWRLLALLSPLPSPTHLLHIPPDTFELWDGNGSANMHLPKGSAKSRSLQCSEKQSWASHGCRVHLHGDVICSLWVRETWPKSTFCREKLTINPCH